MSRTFDAIELNDMRLNGIAAPQKNKAGFYQIEYDPTIDRQGCADQFSYQEHVRKIRYAVYCAKRALGSRYYERLDAMQDYLELKIYFLLVDWRKKKTFYKQGNNEEREAAWGELVKILNWAYVLHVLAETEGDSSSKAFVKWIGSPYRVLVDRPAFEKAERLRAEWDSILG